jgi:hypothetical protein
MWKNGENIRIGRLRAAFRQSCLANRFTNQTIMAGDFNMEIRLLFEGTPHNIDYIPENYHVIHVIDYIVHFGNTNVRVADPFVIKMELSSRPRHPPPGHPPPPLADHHLVRGTLQLEPLLE